MDNLFRKEAQDSFSSRSEVNRPLKPIGIRLRSFILILFLCTILFSLWLMFGTIYDTITVDSVVGTVSSDGGIYSEKDGKLTKRLVSVGDTVHAGDIIAIMPDEELLNEIYEKREELSPEELEYYYSQYDYNSVCRSHTGGIVSYICSENSWVQNGEMIAYIIPYNEEVDSKKLTTYIPASKKELVEFNMAARVMPEYAPAEEYGYINAYVSGISNYPIPGSALLADKQNTYPSVKSDETYVKLEITMIYSEHAKNHLSWSSKKGEKLSVNIGTPCKTAIVINECTPLEWIIGGD